METIYLVCACVGGALLVCQLLAGLLGVGGHHGDGAGHDLSGLDHGGDHGHVGGAAHDHDHGHAHGHAAARFVAMLSLRTVTAALTFFGLAGMAAHTTGREPVLTLVIAVAAGAGAFFLVAYLLRGLGRLHAEGTVRIERAVGQTATVYLRVPANRAGAGKIHLCLQNRTVEYQALTSGGELPTGSKAVVVAVVSADTVEVAPIPETSETRTYV